MKIAVITQKDNDLCRLLKQHATVDVFTADTAENIGFYDAYAILGGATGDALCMPIDLRLHIEAERKAGKRVFAEFCASIGLAQPASSRGTVSDRLVYVGDEIKTLCAGDLLDDRANTRMVYAIMEENARPILLCGGHIIEHDHTNEIPDLPKTDWVLWHNDDNTLISNIRLCNFHTARFAPQKRWEAVAAYILSFLVGKKVSISLPPIVSMDNPPAPAADTFKRGMRWFDNMDLFIGDGAGGVYEGLAHNISPDGYQRKAIEIRADCAGEVGAACMLDWLLHKNKQSLTRFKNTQKFCFEKMTVHDGIYKGMLRWTTNSFGVCYGDDVARAILGTLLYMQLTDDRTYLDTVCDNLDFLVKTTGTDGLRVSRTDIQTMPKERMEQLHNTPSDFPCAHHNGYYMAVLAMAYGLTGKRDYLDTAVKGVETLMTAFPDTIREHSETQELCRLILPLACLYEVTGDEKHKQYVYTVLESLETHRHPRGGYMEYDTGYKANRSRTANTESSLLANNGDPVADLLYSANWLPLAFAYAYKVTKDEKFKVLWQDIVKFMTSVQMKSENPLLDGAWCRGIDLDRREGFGMPHDVGWGPCAVESGWTVAEILMGIGYGLLLGLE